MEDNERPGSATSPLPPGPADDEGEAQLARFGATLAHEIRGPLSPIANGLHILKMVRHHDPKEQRILAMMERQLEQLVALLDDLMDVGGFRTANVRPEIERVELHGVIAASVEACSVSIDLRQQDVSIDSDGSTLVVHGDRRRLTQVFTNLLANSSKYTPPGGHIRVSLASHGDRAIVQVRDDGVGMSNEELPHIFELFNQGTANRYAPSRGLGIGLCVVRNIVHLHGGTVRAHSEGPGRGSSFEVELPRGD